MNGRKKFDKGILTLFGSLWKIRIKVNTKSYYFTDKTDTLANLRVFVDFIKI